MADEKEKASKESEAASNEEQAEEPKDPNRFNKFIIPLAILNTLGVVAVLFALVTHKKKDPHATHKKKDALALSEEAVSDGMVSDILKKTYGILVPLEQFTVNLKTIGTVHPKYVRVEMVLEVPDADTSSEINQKLPAIRGIILDLFNTKTSADVATTKGRNYLKDELQNQMNQFLEQGKITKIYFVSFVVSS